MTIFRPKCMRSRNDLASNGLRMWAQDASDRLTGSVFAFIQTR